MGASPLISIVISHYRRLGLVEQAVGSVVGQTYRPLEIILVDDASDQKDVKTGLEKLKKKSAPQVGRFELLFHRVNKGMNAAYNTGIWAARGELLVMLDSDDDLLPAYSSELIIPFVLQKSKGVGFGYADCWIQTETGKRILGKMEPFDPGLIETGCYLPRTAVFRRECLESVLPLIEEKRLGLAHQMWKQIIKKGWRGMYVQKPLWLYRAHSKNMSGLGEKLKGKKLKQVHLINIWPTDNS